MGNEVEEKVGEALEENFVSLEKKDEKAVEEKKEEPKEDEAEASGRKEAEEEEPSNLQLAWEMLELAKVVYTKQIETGDGDKTLLEERLCSSILALGEVSLENENYSQAVDDIKLCLE